VVVGVSPGSFKDLREVVQMFQKPASADERFPVGTKVVYSFGGFTTHGTVIAVDFNKIKVQTASGIRIVNTTLSTLKVEGK
jgi:hypothetical protein